jgi:hypothetical protein
MRVEFNIWREILDANGGKWAHKKWSHFLAKWLFHLPGLPKILQISETQEISSDISEKYPESEDTKAYKINNGSEKSIRLNIYWQRIRLGVKMLKSYMLQYS